MLNDSTLKLANLTLNALSDQIYAANVKAGWYKNPRTGKKINRNVMEMLMLVVTEVAEGAEGFRKSIKDTHLPNHTMLVVEMADTLIRIFDLIGYIRANPEKFPEYKGIDLGRAFEEKIIYNGSRADHKLSARVLPGGKSC